MIKIDSRSTTVHGLNIHYFTAGHGEPLVVIHGGGEGAKSWIKNIKELARNYMVYVPDLPGFGTSQEWSGNYYIPELVDFVNGFLSAVHIEKCYLIGHSIGGGIALNYALRFPEKVVKLVLISSLCLGKEIAFWIRFFSAPCRYIGKTILSIAKGVIQVVDFLYGPVLLFEAVSSASISFGSSITSLTEQSVVLSHRLPEITVPTLVIWGDKDPVVPAIQAYRAASLIPHCQVKVFEDSGHSVYRQRLSEFSKLLRKFLR